MSAVRIDALAAEQDLEQRARTAALPIARATPRASAPSRAASMLDEFHTHPNALPETNHPGLRRTLLAEEYEELLEALELGDRAEIARELADVVYVVYGTAWVHGIDLDAALDEIHRAAMDKMRAGVRRGDGKIMKPPGFQPPDMTAATDGVAALVAQRSGSGLTQRPCVREEATMSEHTGRERVAAFLNALPFVRWDRFTQIDDELVVYGWIDREDGRADFVLMEFDAEGGVGWTMSSAKWSRSISIALNGNDDGHVDCQRVTTEFGWLVSNVVARAPERRDSPTSRILG